VSAFKSTVERSSPEFRANEAAMGALVAELHERRGRVTV
jgi:hypothetical protein